MASFVVDGLVVPVAVAAHPALNFCNTRAGWGSSTPKEYLHTHAHVTVWARCNGLVAAAAVARLRRAAARAPDAAADVVARAVAFRSSLYGVLLGRAARLDWTVVNREVRAAAAASGLAPGLPAFWEIVDTSRVDVPLLAVAWAAGQLLTSPAAAQVGACPGAGCGWVFENPRGRRRWCSMAWCGNRDKARRHAERIRAGHA